MRHIHSLVTTVSAIGLLSLADPASAEDPWITFEGNDGPGNGKHIVLVSGDEEYRSEEVMPMFGHLLAENHGFKCTVLFAINPEDGTIDPNTNNNIPGLENLQNADLMILALRWRELPDDQMKHIVDFVEAGKPIIGLRTATHSFNYRVNRDSPYAKYSDASRIEGWEGGFGQQILGEKWINHWGHHKVESTRGVINWQLKDNPILRGVRDVWGPTDVYGIVNLGADADVLMFGQVLAGMEPDSPPVTAHSDIPGKLNAVINSVKRLTRNGKTGEIEDAVERIVTHDKNNPMMPLAWTRAYEGESGNTCRVFCTTMGSSTDCVSEDFRRMIVNATYWGLGMEDSIPPRNKADIVGKWNPTPYGFKEEFKDRKRPSELLEEK